MMPTEITVVVRDALQCRVLNDIDDWEATTIIAAVSADPRSFYELGLSWLRYRPEQPLESLPWEDGDAIARRLLAVGGFGLPEAGVERG